MAKPLIWIDFPIHPEAMRLLQENAEVAGPEIRPPRRGRSRCLRAGADPLRQSPLAPAQRGPLPPRGLQQRGGQPAHGHGGGDADFSGPVQRTPPFPRQPRGLG